ncbi:unnamed protein product [Phytophthora fragariaefolia]|uniref:Unnamed protein product n=1 Tax=Phytophthora fragariaefolia TaxID=1490495 RepID=A0A9W7D9L0_9STRA|nr:unnamed protein product [Phytophthora fragariaefolia]
MVRLSHLYAVEEHTTLSQPATVDFSVLFSVKNSVVSEVTELVLTGTKELRADERARPEWKTTDDTYGWSPRSLPVKGTTVVLQAMEVRAFRVCFSKGITAVEEEVGDIGEDKSEMAGAQGGEDVDSWEVEDYSLGAALQDLAAVVAQQ